VLNPEGHNQHTRGRPAGQKPHRVVLWDLQQAAKEASKRGLEILKQCMEDTTCDWNTRLRAIELLFERGYGRAQISAVIESNHRFVVAPDVMDLDQWLERKGQPAGAAGDKWLEAHATEKRTGDGPSTQAGHSGGPPTIDAVAEDNLLLDVDPTAPAPAGKLN
jgi:hypothetical protein